MRIQASAPGKAILFGEHAVVYGKPAIAVPLSGIRAAATGIARANPLAIFAEDLAPFPLKIGGEHCDQPNPLALMACLTTKHLGATSIKGDISIRSDIPIASGLGSGAAVSAALGRAIARLHDLEIPDADLNRLVFEVEKLHHGTPSGIDNTVVVFEMPIYFVKGAGAEFINFGKPLRLVLADTEIASLTRDAVADVRSMAHCEPARIARVFDEIGNIVNEARDCIERGARDRLGALMTANHRLLQALTVSSPELDILVDAALGAGALGAKLSGGGRGGNIIALAEDDAVTAIERSLREAGAKRVMTTVAGKGSQDDDSD